MHFLSLSGRWPAALIEAARRFHQKNGWVMSSHIAMSMMLALFPFVLFTVALTGTVAGLLAPDIEMESIADLVFAYWPQAVAQPLLNELEAVLSTSSTKLATLGGLIALYFASNGVDAVRVAMVQAYHEIDARPFWQARAICIGLVVLGGTGILAVAVFELLLPFYVRYLSDFLPALQLPDQWERGLNGILALCLPVGAVLSFHILLPGRRHALHFIVPGVALTLVLWLLAGSMFAIYIGSFAQYSATYAGLAGAMAALIFLYLNAAILILGAEFNGALIRSTTVVDI